MRLPLFGDGAIVNISLSPNESKAMKFLEDAMKKTLKKLVLKVTRGGKAPNEKYQKTLVLAETKVPKPISGDGSGTFGGNKLMAWMRKLMETL